MPDPLRDAMEQTKALAMAHIVPCQDCDRLLEETGLFCPEGERLKAIADTANQAYVQRWLPAVKRLMDGKAM